MIGVLFRLSTRVVFSRSQISPSMLNLVIVLFTSNDKQIRKYSFVWILVKIKWDTDLAVDEAQTTKDLTHTNITAITKQEATSLITTVKLQRIIPNKRESTTLFFYIPSSNLAFGYCVCSLDACCVIFLMNCLMSSAFPKTIM